MIFKFFGIDGCARGAEGQAYIRAGAVLHPSPPKAVMSVNDKADLPLHALPVSCRGLPTHVIAARTQRLTQGQGQRLAFVRPACREIADHHFAVVLHARHGGHDDAGGNRWRQQGIAERQRQQLWLGHARTLGRRGCDHPRLSRKHCGRSESGHTGGDANKERGQAHHIFLQVQNHNRMPMT